MIWHSVILKKKNIIYEREFSLNLSNTTIYLNIEPKSFFSKYCCTVSNIDKIHLVKINDIILDNVVDNRNGYLIEYRIGIHKKTITIPQLEFILESNNKIYSFICSNRKNFTNWIISILLRQGRELYLFRWPCNLINLCFTYYIYCVTILKHVINKILVMYLCLKPCIYFFY